jgi:hypothetical protein
MVRHRVRITRIIAVFLALALSTQVAGAQAVDCLNMSNMRASDSGGGVTQHQHRSDDARSVATRTGNEHDLGSSTADCNEIKLCGSAATAPITGMRSACFNKAEAASSSGSRVLLARALCPDPPPPRI